MKSRDLHINDVTISTASIDIQVVRIGAKQMTLAVFRQLTRKNIFDKRGNLRASPWGWVNYDWNLGMKPFVFSYEGGLYRGDVHIAQSRALQIEPEMSSEYEDGHYDKDTFEWTQGEWIHTPTGKWLIQVPHAEWLARWNPGHRLVLTFDSEGDARAHLENRQRNIAILEAAPQLFIAV